jgi:phytoene dehydrogenase-like protein
MDPIAVAIVGGGLSGLAAAVQLGAAGTPVVVLDAADQVGGRARTQCLQGFHLNLGPHRLFERGAALSALRRLGVPLPGAPRGPNGGFAVLRGAKHTMPTGYCSLLSTGLFCVAAKLELARFLAGVPKTDVSQLHDVAIGEWLRAQVADPRVVQFVLALVRQTTYSHDPDCLSAAAAIEQLQLSLGGSSFYIHRGWGTLVNSLKTAAVSAGVAIHSDCAVSSVNAAGRHAVSVTLADGREVLCRAVIVATGPKQAASLLGATRMPRTPPVPVCVAALDIALRRLPARRAIFALGIDQPVSLSADSAIVDLAPGAGAVVHTARYLDTGTSGTVDDESALEELMDITQPGWREQVVFRRFLPRVVVSNALVTAVGGGLLGRPNGRVIGLENVFLAGDWIGPTGQLADAAIASGLRAAGAAQHALSGLGAD